METAPQFPWAAWERNGGFKIIPVCGL